MGSFEDAVWRHLVHHHAADRAQAPVRREQDRTRLLVAAVSAVVLAGVIAAAVVVLRAATSTESAYALTQQQDGSVTVSLTDIAAGIPALNAEFAKRGIRETVIPIEPECAASPSGPFSVGLTSMTPAVTVSNKSIPANEQGFIAAKELPDGKILLASGTAPPPVPPCLPEFAAEPAGARSRAP